MKAKIALGFGWFGIATPLLAAFGLLILWNNGLTVSTMFAVQVGIVCAINAFIGYKILKSVAREKKRTYGKAEYKKLRKAAR